MNSLEASAWVDALGWTLIHFLWQGTLIAIAFAALSSFLKAARAESRYVAAILCLALMAIAPVVTLLQIAGRSAAPHPVIAGVIRSVPSVDLRVAVSPEMLPQTHGDLLPLLVALWLTGVLVVAAWSLAGWAVAMRWKRSASAPVDPSWRERALLLARRIGVRGAFDLRQSMAARGPMVIGWLRPVILVPASALLSMPARQLQAILAHELAHIRRNDYLVNLLQRAVEALFFYHPAVWWISTKVREEREHCCDDIAVAACGDAVEYVRALAGLEQMRHTPEMAMAATGGSLVHRVRRLLCPDAHGSSRVPMWLMLSLLIAGSMALWAVAGSPSEDQDQPAAPPAPPARRTRPSVPRTPAPARVPAPPAPVALLEESTPPPAVPAPPAPYAEPGETPEPEPAPVPQIAPPAPPSPAPRAFPQVAVVAAGGEGFLAGIVEAGYGHLSVDEIIRLKENGVSPGFLKGLSEAGWGRLPVEDLVHLHAQGVRADYAVAVRDSGIRLSGPRDLARLRNNGVNPSRLRSIHSAGFGPYSVEDSILLTQHGVPVDFFDALKEGGIRQVAASEAVAAHDHGLNASTIRRIKDSGIGDVRSLDAIIRLKARGGF